MVLILILPFIVESRLTQPQSPFANGALALGNAWSFGYIPIGEISLLKGPIFCSVESLLAFQAHSVYLKI